MLSDDFFNQSSKVNEARTLTIFQYVLHCLCLNYDSIIFCSASANMRSRLIPRPITTATNCEFVEPIHDEDTSTTLAVVGMLTR